MEKESKVSEKFSLKREFFDFCEIIVFAMVIATLIFTFLFRIVGVDGSSMEYTLSDQDRLIITHLFYEPEQGDIVVLELDELFEQPIIKRVVATEGQTVDITDDGKVIVDGQELQEDYIHDPTNPKNGDYPITVPENCVFVMGDNRNNSTDSRNFGCVDEKNIMGQAVFQIFPFSEFGLI